MKTKTVLFDKADIYKCEIDEVLGYYGRLFMWAVVSYKDSPKRYSIPLYALAIERRPVFND